MSSFYESLISVKTYNRDEVWTLYEKYSNMHLPVQYNPESKRLLQLAIPDPGRYGKYNTVFVDPGNRKEFKVFLEDNYKKKVVFLMSRSEEEMKTPDIPTKNEIEFEGMLMHMLSVGDPLLFLMPKNIRDAMTSIVIEQQLL